ncbi:MAG: Crp/Fnr family transcriptional regulator [Gammaproteobacteria bacterium]|nr:Crp/Fnr family transcriptional regulator [Gammaproteobacteria bacterium]
MPNLPSWKELFPEQQTDAELDTVLARAQCLNLPAGMRVFIPGATCENYLLVGRGRVRVQLLTAGGREVVLYHVGEGDSCVLTTSCLLGASTYPAEGITETEVMAFTLSARDFNQGLDTSPGFRHFVFANLGRRLSEVIVRMEQVAFAPIDARLASCLLTLAGQQGHLELTHQTLAVELGSAREVISRHLKRFEDHGWVRLGRGNIEVLDSAALQDIARLS